MPAWMSAIADGNAATARLMSVAALSTASSMVRACPSADSAARTASTRPPWLPAGLATRVRPWLMFWSANFSRCLAVSTLLATAASAVSANCACRPVIVCCAGSRRAVRSTICWVSVSSRVGALMTRSRSCWKASRWASSSRSALAAATITRVSRSRRCCGVSGTASSRIWRTLNACESVVLAFVTAAVNGAVSLSPNSSTANANSLSLVRTALSTSTTIDRDRSSSVSMETDASALGSAGSTRCAAANSASRRLRRLRRRHSSSAISAMAMITRMTTTPTQLISPFDDEFWFRPPAAATAAPAQSPWRSAGSISLRRSVSTSTPLGVGRLKRSRRGHPWRRQGWRPRPRSR